MTLLRIPSQRDLFLKTLEVHQALYEKSHGVVGHRLLLGMPTLLLRTKGRKTGQTRTSALVYATDAGRHLVVGSNGGTRLDPAWILNLEANPNVTFQVGVRTRAATATVLRTDDPDYERLFALCNKANRGTYAKYRSMTDRPLPIVVLTPVGS